MARPRSPRKKASSKTSPMLRVACFDLETSSLNANFGIILCGVIQPQGEKAQVFRGDKICPTWDNKRSDDSALVEVLARELASYDILFAHNGLRFDVPFMRTRMARWRLGVFPERKLVDPYQVAKRHFRLQSNGLASMGDFFFQNRKTTVSGDIWLRAFLDGDRKCMNYIVEHCIIDVAMLAEITEVVKGYVPVINSRGSA
jgi:uncharacterized protein YprB with RNaseH-like and TPR domain